MKLDDEITRKEIEPISVLEKESPVVYDGLTYEDLVLKFNKIMKSSLEKKGEIFVSHSLEMNVDPYIALAIVFQETGCYQGNCSTMVRECNNIGGMKASTKLRCFGGSYSKFESIDQGIISFIDNLAYGYFYQGLNTPELMNRKYASDPLWAARVNNYINIIKNS